MKVLITGASGLVGRHVSEYLEGHGYQVIGTDVRAASNQGSVTDRTFVFERLANLDFDAVLHLAAIADLKQTIQDPYACYEVNCFGTLNVLELALRKGVKRLIFASSANVYGAPRSLPVAEEAPMNPRVPYDYSKVVGENLAMSYFTTKGLPVTITRSWLLFGERDLPNRAIPRFIGACLKDEPIQLFNSGRDATAPSHAINYGRLVATVLENDSFVGRAFNFGGEKVQSIRELAETIRGITGSKSQLIMLPPRSEAEKEPQVSYPSTERIRERGYTYELSLEEGIKRVVDSVRQASAGKC